MGHSPRLSALNNPTCVHRHTLHRATVRAGLFISPVYVSDKAAIYPPESVIGL